MTLEAKNNTVNITYYLIAGVAVFLTWELHEFGHWMAGTILGYDMIMTLNANRALSTATDWHSQIISAAGPIVTLVEAVLVFLLMRCRNHKSLYPFLFACLYCRLMAALISFVNLNDEARISKFLGIGTFTLPFIVSAILFFLVYATSRRYGFSKKFNAVNLGLVILYSSIIILTDQFLHIRLL